MTKLQQIVQENINRFSFAQMTSNNNGKTSGSGTMGVYLIFIGGLIGLIASLDALFGNSTETSNVLLFATGSIMTGAGLLGYRKSKEGVMEPITPEGEGETPPTL